MFLHFCRYPIYVLLSSNFPLLAGTTYSYSYNIAKYILVFHETFSIFNIYLTIEESLERGLYLTDDNIYFGIIGHLPRDLQ